MNRLDRPITDADTLTPEAAVAQLIALHEEAVEALRQALERFFAKSQPPTAKERARFRYPELRLTYASGEAQPSLARAYAKFESPGIYATTITQPRAFQDYLIEQLRLLVADYPTTISVGRSDEEIPYPYVLDKGDELGRDNISAAELARHFPAPALSAVGDEIADGLWTPPKGEPMPLALFDATRTDYSLKRIVHYTGTDWRQVQPWILLTNYHRYVDQFVTWGIEQIRNDSSYDALVLPGGVMIGRGGIAVAEAETAITSSPWHLSLIHI